MNPITANLPSHHRGDKWQGIASGSLTDAEENPVSFTGARIVFQARSRPSRAGALLLQRTTDDGGITIAENGLTFAIPGGEIDIAPGTAYYEIEVEFPGELGKLTVFAGEWPIAQDVAHEC
jgi:hypothetical protein